MATDESDTTQPAATLRLCPFCDCTAHLHRTNAERFQVVCGNDDCGIRTMFWRTAEDAAASWNRQPDAVKLDDLPGAQP